MVSGIRMDCTAPAANTRSGNTASVGGATRVRTVNSVACAHSVTGNAQQHTTTQCNEIGNIGAYETKRIPDTFSTQRTGVQTSRTELAGSTRAMVTPDGSAATAGSPMNFSDRNGTPSKATCTGPSGARVRFVRNRHSTRASSCNSDTLPQQSPHHEQHVTATSTTSPLYCSMSHDVTNTILQQLQKHATSALATLHAAAEACSPGRP